jgi:hypothetical protein
LKQGGTRVIGRIPYLRAKSIWTKFGFSWLRSV